MQGRILVAPSNAESLRALRQDLEPSGAVIEVVEHGDQVLSAVWRRPPGILILSQALPGKPDALTICGILQQGPVRVPVLVTAAQDVPDDHVRALRAGADDYMALPFTGAELVARVEALLRRMQPPVETIRLGGTVVDFRQHMVIAGPRPVFLTNREFEVLRCLAARRGGIVTREELLQLVWGCAPTLVTRTVDNCMLRLRRKLEQDPHHPTYIRKAYGDGYRLLATEWALLMPMLSALAAGSAAI
jgi:DNA-binding response OmpR family regulator